MESLEHKATCPYCGKISQTLGTGWVGGCSHAEGRTIEGHGPITLTIEGHGPITLPIKEKVTFFFKNVNSEVTSISN